MKDILRKNRIFYLPFIILGFLLLFVFNLQKVNSATSPDAISIRVMKNFDHLSAADWYRAEQFSCSPQTLKVDGYSAIRDGRTVYVNVANISSIGVLYTNIYLISYNQEAENHTIDIFGNILSHWKFNSNLASYGVCRTNHDKDCVYDKDCSANDYCDGNKSRVIRDVNRLENINVIKSVFELYKIDHDQYPVLGGGSYIPKISMSVWPSWRDEFSRELGIDLPFDVVNILGDCGDMTYNEKTCWNEEEKKFVIPNFPTTLILPDNSLVTLYRSRNNGDDYDLCFSQESVYNISPSFVAPGCADVCLDFDGDGYGRPASLSCTYPELDCDDSDASFPIWIALVESVAAGTCQNGIDDDCDGLLDCDDDTCSSLPACGIVSPCGDHDCNPAIGETCGTCPTDCGACPCGDGVCDPTCADGSPGYDDGTTMP